MDDDLQTLDRDALIAEVKKLRAGIRAHRDTSGHDLCWHHPQLWGLLPEPIAPDVAVHAVEIIVHRSSPPGKAGLHRHRSRICSGSRWHAHRPNASSPAR